MKQATLGLSLDIKKTRKRQFLEPVQSLLKMCNATAMRQPYPSDISRGQFEQILPLLESARRKTSPRRIDLFEVFCAVLYLLRTGCQWRALPRDFPKWRTVHSYFAIWSEPRGGGSLLEQALKKIRLARPASAWAGALSQRY